MGSIVEALTGWYVPSMENYHHHNSGRANPGNFNLYTSLDKKKPEFKLMRTGFNKLKLALKSPLKVLLVRKKK